MRGYLGRGGKSSGLGFGAERDTGLIVVVDGRQGAEEQAGDVGKGGGAASGDAIAGDEFIKLAEGMVDALSGLKLDGSFGQWGIEIGVLVESSFLGEVVSTEAELRVRG